ncbi:unnamed protein product [Symbiodinium natans]|uniref:Uncharacterized protein n=1 Tax=Symbiodinium natans TaxID=878477 RepID=A0A812RIJ7_9DINO|nr:unnamed protein product [Symbiodinium natans]
MFLGLAQRSQEQRGSHPRKVHFVPGFFEAFPFRAPARACKPQTCVGVPPSLEPKAGRTSTTCVASRMVNSSRNHEVEDIPLDAPKSTSARCEEGQMLNRHGF